MSDQPIGAGLRLLHALLERGPGGRVFTSEEAVAAGTAVGLSPGHIYKLLTDLTARGSLQRPRGHLYVMQAPYGGLSPVRPLAIAVRAVAPAAVSGDTALVYWGLQDQAPLHEETVSTPTRIQWDGVAHAGHADRLWTVAGGTIRFHRIPVAHMVGITTVRLDSETVVPMFDRERSIAEVLARRTAEATELAGDLLRTHSPEIDMGRLLSYAGVLGVELPAIQGTRATVHQ